jgi:hypothetical protein
VEGCDVSAGCGGGWVWLFWPGAFWPQMANASARSAMDDFETAVRMG